MSNFVGATLEIECNAVFPRAAGWGAVLHSYVKPTTELESNSIRIRRNHSDLFMKALKSRRIWGFLSISMLLAGAAHAEVSTYHEALALFTPDAYIEHVRILASDEYEGRGTGQPGNDMAAKYISEHFAAMGLKPGGVDGTWFQPFDVRKGKKLEADHAEFKISGVDDTYEVKKDWTPFPFSATGDFDGTVVFVGYGIESPDDGFDDYANLDVRDKIVLVMRYEPKSKDDGATIGGRDPSKHALFATKARVAAKHGAKAMLVVNPPLRDEKDDLYKFGREGSRETYELPMVHIKQQMASTLLSRGGLPTLEQLEKDIAEDRKSHSAALANVQVTVKSGLVSNELKTKNVLGILEGDGSTDEFVVVGGHFDHLGIAARMFGSDDKKFIHNGADDNASGTAGVLEMARVLMMSPKLHRNVLFICFSGEEMGLLGSAHYVDNPTIPLAKIRAMMNFDMIGRFSENDVMIYGVPTAEEFSAVCDRASAETGMPYKLGKSLPGNSDHYSFQQKKIPVIFPFTGLHRQYHKPEDDWELIKPDGATRILKFSYLTLVDVANMKDGPTWKDPRKRSSDSDGPAADTDNGDKSKAANKAQNGDSKVGEKSDPHAALADKDSDAAAPPMPKVRLGVVPDYSEDGKPGLRLNDVTPGSAAEKAGIKGGDRIIKIGDTPVRGIESYMLALGKFKPDDEVEIVVERDGQPLTLKAKLSPPPTPKASD